MRCNKIQERLDELKPGELRGEARAHLEHCAACQAYARQGRWLAAGFRALAAEAVPETSWGFAQRLLRRWDEAQAQDHSMESFFEQVGRRFIFGTLVLTMVLLLALILPPSGPVRGSTSAELLAAQPETVTVRPDPILGDQPQDTSESPANNPGGGEVQPDK